MPKAATNQIQLLFFKPAKVLVFDASDTAPSPHVSSSSCRARRTASYAATQHSGT
jgi:hypothetical protein